jgi:hypothetical protein
MSTKTCRAPPLYFSGALREALAGPPASERRLLAYVAAVIDCSFDCPTEVLWGPATADTIRQNPRILAELVQRLRQVARRTTAPEAPVRQSRPRRGYG